MLLLPMLYIIGVALVGIALLSPLTSLAIYNPGGRELERVYLTEGSQVVISHINSIYDARVDELLELKDGALELTNVKTASHGVHEYYRTDDRSTKHRFTEISLINSADREFAIVVNKKRLNAIEENKNTAIRIRIEKSSVGSRLMASSQGSPLADKQ